jgi:hypothetical protein
MTDPSRSNLTTDTVIGAFEVMANTCASESSWAKSPSTAAPRSFSNSTGARRPRTSMPSFAPTSEKVRSRTRPGYAGLKLGLPDDWLNDYVGGFTPETEPDAFFSAYGTYPRGATPGLRVFLAKLEYVCVMKLKALQRDDVGERDFEDAVRLGLEIGISTVDEFARLFASFFPQETLDPIRRRACPRSHEKFRHGGSDEPTL